MSKQFGKAPRGFANPEQLPEDSKEANEWQEANRAFWESSPMRYDWHKVVPYEDFSRPFYQEIDKRFFETVKKFMPWKRFPFDNLIDFEAIQRQSVLEIGVGMGSHAQLIAAHAGEYTGIDITDCAVKATSARLEAFDLRGSIQKMDAEHMLFPDATFDAIWSWGVIHHSSNTQKVVREMHRVLKPGGEAVIMIYNRGWWNYYAFGGAVFGIARGGFFKTGSLSKSIQMNTDGALARYYTKASWRRLVGDYFDVEYTMVKGPKTDLFPLPGGRLKNFVMALFPDAFTRFLTNRCRMGAFLITKVRKKG
jgi:ubiquinone/menaquinone biosynthesis C-methylase UbiE